MASRTTVALGALLLWGCVSGPRAGAGAPEGPGAVIIRPLEPSPPAPGLEPGPWLDALGVALGSASPLVATQHELARAAVVTHTLTLRQRECVVVAAASRSSQLTLVVRDPARPVLELNVSEIDAAWQTRSALSFCAPRSGGYVARLFSRGPSGDDSGVVQLRILRTPRAAELAQFLGRRADPEAQRLEGYHLEMEARGYQVVEQGVSEVQGRRGTTLSLEPHTCYAVLAISDVDVRIELEDWARHRRTDDDTAADLARYCTDDSDLTPTLWVQVRGAPRSVEISLLRSVARVRTHPAMWQEARASQAEMHALLALEGWAPFSLVPLELDSLDDPIAPTVALEPGQCWLALPVAKVGRSVYSRFDQWNVLPPDWESEARAEMRAEMRAGWPGGVHCPTERESVLASIPEGDRVSHVELLRRPAHPEVVVRPQLTAPPLPSEPAGSWLLRLLQLEGFVSGGVSDPALAEIEGQLARTGRAEVDVELEAGKCYAFVAETEGVQVAVTLSQNGRVVTAEDPRLVAHYCADEGGRYRLRLSTDAHESDPADAAVRLLARVGRVPTCDPDPPMGPRPIPLQAPEWVGREAPVAEQNRRAAQGILYDCLRGNSSRVTASYLRYTRSIDPATGPRPGQSVGPMLTLGGDGSECREELRGHLPALFDLEEDARRYADAIAVLREILEEVDRYYSRGHARDDHMARGQQLHAPLMEAFGVASCLQDRMIGAAVQLNQAAVRAELQTRPTLGRDEIWLRVAYQATEVWAGASQLTIDAGGHLRAPNLADYESRLAALETELNTLGAFENTHGGQSGMYRQGQTVLAAGRAMRRRVVSGPAFTSAERATRRSGAQRIDGSYEALTAAYDDLSSEISFGLSRNHSGDLFDW